MARHLRLAFLLVAGSLTAACGGDDSGPFQPGTPGPAPVPVPASVAISSGNQQQAAAGDSVAVAPAVVVRDASGQPVSGVQVHFAVEAGGGSVLGATPSTNAQGVAQVTRWTLGPIGPQRLHARVGSLPPAVFEATILPGTEQLVVTIGAGGGSLHVDDPDHPFHGLRFQVPAGAAAAGTEWRFRVETAAPTLSLPAGFRVAGPGLSIATGQARANALMTLDVPVSHGSNEEVVIILQDPASGAFEVMPMVARGEGSVRVMTAHLRGDLILGATPVAGSFSRGVGRAPLLSVQEGRANLFSLAYETPLAPVAVEPNPWPVVEHGSAAYPGGHGAAIAVLQAAGAALEGLPSLRSLVRPLDTPGFYAEAAPLAVKTITHEQVTPVVSAMASRIYQELALQDKWERDRMITNQIIAQMALQGRLTAAIHRIVESSPEAFHFSSVVAGTEAGLTLGLASQDAPTEITRTDGGGFQRVLMAVTAAAPQVEVEDAFPLSSFLAPFEQVGGLLQGLSQLSQTALGSPARAQLNNAMADLAAMPRHRLDREAFLGGGWSDIEDPQVVIRTAVERIRVHFQGPTPFALHALETGAELGRVEGEPMELSGLPAILAQADLEPFTQIVSAFSVGAGGVARQIRPFFQEMVKAPFGVEPSEITLGGEDTTVEFEARVDFPPASGFRIQWQWGDGTTTESLGIARGSHTYDEHGTYEVVATLLSSNGEDRLAVDTVRVTDNPGMWVGSVWGTSQLAHGTTHFEAKDLRWEVASAGGSGWTRWDLRSGSLAAWREVPCASYVSPVSEVSLPAGPEVSLWVSASNEQAPEGAQEAEVWYQGRLRATGLQVMNSVCPTSVHPNPTPYVFHTSLTIFQTSDHSTAPPWPPLPSDNRNLLRGSLTQNHGGAVTTWNWDLRRVWE